MQCTFMFAVHNSPFRSYFRANLEPCSNLNKSWGGFMFIDAYCLSIEFCSDLLIEYVHIDIYLLSQLKRPKFVVNVFCSDLFCT